MAPINNASTSEGLTTTEILVFFGQPMPRRRSRVDAAAEEDDTFVEFPADDK
jgi:hypothetical protein